MGHLLAHIHIKEIYYLLSQDRWVALPTSVIKFQGLEEKEIIKDSRYAVIANLSHNLAIHLLESGTKELVLPALILFLAMSKLCHFRLSAVCSRPRPARPCYAPAYANK